MERGTGSSISMKTKQQMLTASFSVFKVTYKETATFAILEISVLNRYFLFGDSFGTISAADTSPYKQNSAT